VSPRALAFALGLLSAGCAHAPPRPATSSPPAAVPRAAACLILADSARPARPITAAFDDPTDAALARLAANRLAPVRLDCEGHPGPGLAIRWSADTSARFWTLELAPPPSGATEDRVRWTAAALAATWRSDPDAGLALRAAGVQSALPLDDRRLVVEFATPERELPAVFAARALAVARGGPTMLLEDEPPSRDLRDAIDHGPDLVQTGDPDLLDYAGRRPGLTRVALPWSRVYLLLLPAGGPGVAAAVPADTAEFRAALARNVVRAEARPADDSAWPDSAARCSPAPAAPPSSSSAIVYPAADATARALAERLVALAGPAGLAVRGLEPDSLSAALRRGDARAFVVSGPRMAAGACAESSDWPAGARAVPLVETRAHAIVRRGAPPLAVEWDGAVRPAEPGDTSGATP
jgi:hypothetical protein